MMANGLAGAIVVVVVVLLLAAVVSAIIDGCRDKWQ
jgi:hypothetical protein